MTRFEMLHRELTKSIRASGRAHAKVAELCRRPVRHQGSLRKLGAAAFRASLAQGRVAGFVHLIAAEQSRSRRP